MAASLYKKETNRQPGINTTPIRHPTLGSNRRAENSFFTTGDDSRVAQLGPASGEAGGGKWGWGKRKKPQEEQSRKGQRCASDGWPRCFTPPKDRFQRAPPFGLHTSVSPKESECRAGCAQQTRGTEQTGHQWLQLRRGLFSARTQHPSQTQPGAFLFLLSTLVWHPQLTVG